MVFYFDKKANFCTILNPWNDPRRKNQWKQKQTFTIDEFFNAFSYMSYWQIKTNTFLDNKSIRS